MKYKNIFEYLDQAFVNTPNPTKEDIINAKKQYYKQWHRHYNRKRRAKRKEFTLGFDVKRLQQLKEKKGTRTISKYLYAVVYEALNTKNTSINDQHLLSTIHQKIGQLVNVLEELLDTGVSPEMEVLLERIEELEIQFRKL